MSARRITLLSLATCLVLGAASSSWGIPINWDRGGGNDNASNPLNWNPNQIPTAADDVVLDGLAPGDDQIVDLANGLQVRRIETAAGADNYTFDNGTIEIFLAEGNALLTRGGSLTVNSDVRFGSGNFGPRFNTIAGAPPIVVNGTVAPSDSNSTDVTLEITSRNLDPSPQITVAGVISDGSSSTLALTAGFATDSENHRGVVRVTGNNTYTGQTIVNGATLEFDSIGNVGGGASALGAPTTVGNGTIRLGAIDSGGVRVPGTLTYTGTAAAQTNRQIQLEGDGGIIAPADAAGSLTLNGDIFSDNPLINPAINLVLQLQGTGSHEVAGDISDSGEHVRVLKVGTGTWRLSGNNTYTGTTTNLSGRLIVDTNSLPAPGGVFNNGELEFDQTTSATYAGDISGSGDLIKSGDFSFLTLTGTNTYTGETIITDGSISIGSIANIGVASPLGMGSTLRLAGNGARLIYTGLAASTNRNIVLETGNQPDVFSATRLTLSGVISGTAGGFFDISGSGSIELTGTNTYNAAPNIKTQSTLSVPSVTDSGVPGPLGMGNQVSIGLGATFEYSGAAAGTTDRRFTLGIFGNLTQTIRVLSNELEITGLIEEGTFNKILRKNGAGILTLTGANTFASNTRVEAGTLRVNNTNGSGTGTGDVTVIGLATLGGTGTISGDVQINTSGILNPGASTGTLTVGGDVNFLSLSNLRIEIAGRDAGQFDLLDVGGTADVEGLLSVDLLDFIPLTSDQFTIVTAGTLGGGFSGLLSDSRIGTFDGEGTFFVDLDYDADVVVLSDFRLSNPPTGDFDADGDVDGGDFLAWQRGEVSNPPSASDLADWEANFGTAPGPLAAASAVPEPGTMVLFALALAALIPTHRFSSDL